MKADASYFTRLKKACAETRKRMNKATPEERRRLQELAMALIHGKWK